MSSASSALIGAGAWNLRTAPTLVALTLLALVAGATAGAAPAFKRSIQIRPAQVSGGPLTNYPFLFNTTVPDLRTTANGGRVTNANGWDIIFATSPSCADSTSCGGAKLDHEIERYNGATGELVAWVRLPSIDNGTVFYIHYGDSAVGSSTENRTGVWDASYQGVWHLSEAPANGTTGGHIDSKHNTTAGATPNNGTPQGFTGAPSSTNATGIAAGANRFYRPQLTQNAANDDRIVVADDDSLDPPGDMTFEAWVNAVSLPAPGSNNVHVVAQKNHSSSPWLSYQFYFAGTSTTQLTFGWYNSTGTGGGGAGGGWWVDNNTAFATGTWYHIAGVHTGTALTIYVNGSAANTTAMFPNGTTQDTHRNSDAVLTIGNINSNDLSPDAVLDEVRLSSSARSAGWLLTQYRNISSPSTFYEVGALGIFYSVGTQSGPLYSGDASASNGTLNLASAAASNVGVGDEIREGSNRYYITGRVSPMVFTIQNSAATGTPGATNITFGLTTIAIHRAFNLISDAVSGSMNSSHLNTSNLVTGNYQLNWPCYADNVMTNSAIINGYTTGPLNYIRLYTPVFPSQVGVSQRHSGVFGTGFRVGVTDGIVIDNREEYVRIEGLVVQMTNTTAFSTKGGIVSGTSAASDIRISHNIVKGVISNSGTSQTTGIRFGTGSNDLDVHRVSNNIVYNFTDVPATSDLYGIQFVDGTSYVFNNTVFNCDIGFVEASSANAVQLRNNVSINDVFDPTNRQDYALYGITVPISNVSSDGTGTAPLQNKNLPANYFQIITLNSEDLHLRNTALNLWGANGVNLSADANLPVANDIDRQGRIRPDHGADEFNGTTVVTLRSFAAAPLDKAVALSWETASELDNLGFHLYRAPSGDGPWTRITASLIRGLGSSPEGQRYSWTDLGLTNATTYHYRLEDVDRSGLATSHGPVSATPAAGLAAEAPPPTEPHTAPGSDAGAAWRAYGEPSVFDLRVLRRTRSSVTLELTTGGFFARAEEDGATRLHVPGFFELSEPGLPSVPTRRAWLEVPAGSGVRIASVVPHDTVAFRGLEVGRAGAPQSIVERGAYRAGFRRVRARATHGLYPDSLARVLETAFQGETKKAYLELCPLRVDAGSGQVVLARKLVVRLVFQGRAARERSRGGSRGRLEPRPAQAKIPASRILARLATRSAGLHAVAFEGLATAGVTRGVSSSGLRLSRLGQPVAFHVEPRAEHFGPGSTLYFVADGPEAAYGVETVYELAIAAGGVQMRVGATPARPASTLLPSLMATRTFEQNTNYLPGLLNARDLWLWDLGLLPPDGRDYPFTLSAPSAGEGPAVLSVDLQGGSEAAAVDPDHHVLVFVNGVSVGEAHWDGLNPTHFETSVDAKLLVDGVNTLRLENLDTTGRYDSAVYLDRFAVDYPRQLVAEAGRLEGRAPSAGLVRAAGFSPGGALLDVSAAVPEWLPSAVSGTELTFAAEAGKRYLAVSAQAVLRPEVRPAVAPALRSASLQADWIVIAPQELLSAAEPLVAHRESQGLRAMAVSLEQIQDEFGYGERSPQMLRDFLAYAYHHWTAPSVRYVLLLGDASSDPKGYLPTAMRKDLLPTPLVKSTFLWTASDPWLAAVNGDDAIPDLAIGRLSAGSLAEAEAAVGKILAFEQSGQTLDGKAVLVADNPDKAGDFEANANDIATLLSGRQVERIFLTQLGAGTRSAVLGAFDAGAALVSYVGHGSQALWASESILRSIDVALLQPQPRQPLLLTMTCSNGYFISPWLNGIAERFVLEGGKGAIAAFSPSGLSLDEAAHLYHRALVQELESRRHERLGDLVLAAQKDYADTGAFPELLSIYHLFADPALRILRP